MALADHKFFRTMAEPDIDKSSVSNDTSVVVDQSQKLLVLKKSKQTSQEFPLEEQKAKNDSSHKVRVYLISEHLCL